MSLNGFCSAGLLGHRCVPKQPVCGCVDGGSQSCFSCRRDRRTNPAEHQSRSPSSNAALCTALHWLHCTAYIAVTHYLCRSTATKLCPVEPGTLLLPLASPRPLLPPSSLPQPPASTTSTSALALPACFCFGPPSSHARAPLLRRTASAIPASHRSCLAYQGSSCILLVLPSHLSSLLPSHHHLTTDTNALMRIA